MTTLKPSTSLTQACIKIQACQPFWCEVYC